MQFFWKIYLCKSLHGFETTPSKVSWQNKAPFTPTSHTAILKAGKPAQTRRSSPLPQPGDLDVFLLVPPFRGHHIRDVRHTLERSVEAILGNIDIGLSFVTA